MRTTLTLLSLFSLLLFAGCEKSVPYAVALQRELGQAAETPADDHNAFAEVDEIDAEADDAFESEEPEESTEDVPADDKAPDDPKPDKKPEEEKPDAPEIEPTAGDVEPAPLQLASGEVAGPDPLAEEPQEVMGLLKKSTKRTPKVWLNYYYKDPLLDKNGRPLTDGYGNPLANQGVIELARLKSWANGRGLTVANATDANFRYAQVRIVNMAQTPVRRNLTYDGNSGPLVPTLVFLSADGTDLGHIIGYLNTAILDGAFNSMDHRESKKPLKQEETAVDPPPNSPQMSGQQPVVPAGGSTVSSSSPPMQSGACAGGACVAPGMKVKKGKWR